MTEKRFTLREPNVDYTIGCSEIADNGEWITYGEITDLLNELHEENVELHIQNDFFQCENKHFREVLEENRLLKSNIHTVINNYTRQLKRHTLYFEIMMDLARDLGIDVKKLEALDD